MTAESVVTFVQLIFLLLLVVGVMDLRSKWRQGQEAFRLYRGDVMDKRCIDLRRMNALCDEVGLLRSRCEAFESLEARHSALVQMLEVKETYIPPVPEGWRAEDGKSGGFAPVKVSE